MQNELTTYLRAGYPGLAITSPEEARAEREIAAACTQTKRTLTVWSTTDGLVELPDGRVSTCADPIEMLLILERQYAASTPQRVTLLRDLQLHLDQADPMLVRRLKDLLYRAKGNGHTVVLLGCRHKLPPELEHEFTQMRLALPGPDRLAQVLDGIIRSAKLQPPPAPVREAAIRSALGMTTVEAENAFALSVVGARGIDPELIAREKARTLQRGGLVEVVESPLRLRDIGGLENLKLWLRSRSAAFTDAARAYGLPMPKGLLIVGIPGTGKSLTAKATAGAFGLPLLRLDMGRVFGGFVGQSEANLRAVIQTAEAIAPCVLWIDEIEKGLAGGSGGSGNDGGTSSRVFGGLLSWMQEKQKPVFVVATANDISQLPPEFLRKGRFDEMFFVDLPDAAERASIWDIVISRHRRDPRVFDTGALATASDQFTGAEIEAVFVDALYRAYAAGKEPVVSDIRSAISATVPLARTMDTRIERLRQWSQGRAQPASTQEGTKPRSPGDRRLQTPVRERGGHPRTPSNHPAPPRGSQANPQP